MKFFNTAGPINPKDHYYVPHRFNDATLFELIDQKKYFILHAARQSGKTTSMRVFCKQLNETGKLKALYVNVEPAQVARSNITLGLNTILRMIRAALIEQFGTSDPAITVVDATLNQSIVSHSTLFEFLQSWSLSSPKPIILFIDEIDSLVGDTLISVLRQLRAGYTNRPHAFPQSVCLIGVRDVRDYLIWSDAEQKTILGGSAFNIKAESLTLEDFSLEQLHDLYLQHTQETGQKFTDEAIQYAFYLTQGQPWLTNALAYQACFVDITDRAQPITKEVIERAKEVLIKRQDTHLDVIANRLDEPRVYKIIDAIINGTIDKPTTKADDLQYVKDLGLIRTSAQDIVIANPIYQEILPRILTNDFQSDMAGRPVDYINADGSLNMNKLLEKFTEFYRENSATWLQDFNYKESGPHLLLMAFLQRIINGGGSIHREYALGRKRVDLAVKFASLCFVIEIKVWHGPKALLEGLEQTADYMDISDATEGHLVIFDRDLKKPWEEKIYHKQESVDGKTINVWGM